MELVVKDKINNEDLEEAIKLRINKCFPAMNIANSLAGYQSTAWKILRQHTPLDIFDEAIKRGLPVKTYRGSVDNQLITESEIWESYIEIKAGNA